MGVMQGMGDLSGSPRVLAGHVAESEPRYEGLAKREVLWGASLDARPAYLPTLAEVEHAAACVLAALYLPGAPRGFDPPRRCWAEVLRCLRFESSSLRSCGRVLERRGFASEALCLESPGLLAWAEREVLRGRVLTAACSAYPADWVRKLGAGCPIALWKRGVMPDGPYLAVVGGREVAPPASNVARRVGRHAVALGYGVVSGAAAGCDRAAARGAVQGAGSRGRASLPLIEVLPCGLGLRRERFAGCVLSPFAPGEPFSGPNAMQRNALIYALAEAAVVVGARLGEGGTWKGAVEANRRRLTRLIVWDDGGPAARALVALGAVPLESPESLAPCLRAALTPGGFQGELSLS